MRHIASEMFSDEFFGSLPMVTRMLWIGLIAAVADDQGRLIDNAALLRSRVFPYDTKVTNKDVEAALTQLAKGHKIDRYTHGNNGSGKRLIQIVNWWKYQRPQWAAESNHPAPPKWVDRIRIHKPGLGNVPYEQHWKDEGGYIRPMKDVATRQARRYTNTNTNTNGNLIPPPIPSSKKKAAKTGGGGKDKKQKTKPEPITADQKRLTFVASILEACGLRNPRRDKVSALVAARKTVRDEALSKYVVAAIASAYSDKTAKNKAVCAAHRLEAGEVAESFMNPDTWRDVPNEVLIAAGLLKESKPTRHEYVDGQLVAVPA